MSVEVVHDGPVAVVTLTRPDSLNAWHVEMMGDLATQVSVLNTDPAVGAVILTGSGRGFCAGIDLSILDMERSDGTAREYLRRVTKLHHEATLGIVRGPKPWIAAINGAAAGGGLALAMACDIRLAAPHAKFTAGFLRVGVAPDGGTTWFLPRLMGFGRAREFLLMNEVWEASAAQAAGLITAVVDKDKLMEEAKATATELASRPPGTLSTTKARLADVLGLEQHLELERAGTVDSAQSDEFDEGVRAFVERRPPKFR